MRRFEFPLESILRLRRFHEAEARQALQQAIFARDTAEEALAATRREIAAATRRLTDDQAAMRPAEVVNAWVDLDRLEQLALKQAQILADRESEVVVKRDAYLEAQRERKPLERLREEMELAHRQEAELAQQKVTEEVAMIAHSRREKAP